MVNIFNNDKADDGIENNGFIFISQMKARASIPTSHKKSRIAYLSSLNDEEAAINPDANKNTN